MRLGSYLPVHRGDGMVAITLPAEVDFDHRTAILDQALALLGTRPAVFVVDMSATRFCDSSGIDLLLRLHRRARLLGSDLRIVVRHASVRKVLAMCGVDRLLTIDPGGDDLRPAPLPPAVPRGRSGERS